MLASRSNNEYLGHRSIASTWQIWYVASVGMRTMSGKIYHVRSHSRLQSWLCIRFQLVTLRRLRPSFCLCCIRRHIS